MPSSCAPKYPITPRTSQLFSLRTPVVDDDGLVHYRFPNPFQLFGLGVPFPPSTIEFGTAPNTYENWDWDVTSSQFANYLSLIAPLFVSFMYANRATDNPEFGIIGEPAPFTGVTYKEVRAYGRYYGYMMNHLNESLKPDNYNTFTEPILEIYKYWANLKNADAGDVNLNPQNFILDPVKFLLNKMFTSGSDKRLWGVPGEYIIDPVTPVAPVFAITINNDNSICPNVTTIHLPAPAARPNIADLAAAFITFNSDFPFAIPNPIPLSVNPAVGVPASFSNADIIAWIQAEYLAAFGIPLSSPVSGLDDAGIEEVNATSIKFQNGAGIDGCPFAPIQPGVIGSPAYVSINFTLSAPPPNPFLAALQTYFDNNGFYPNLLTGEFYLPD